MDQEITNVTTTPAPAPTTPPRYVALQNRAMAERITEAETILKNALQDADLIALLTPYGYDAAALQAGLELQQAALEAFNARQQTIAARRTATAAARTLFNAIVTSYLDYRRVGRALFRNPRVRAALGLGGRFPKDREQIVQFVRAAYHTASTTPEYAAEFARRGYPNAKFTELLAALDTWVEASGTHAAAAAENVRTTHTRNDAVAALDAWMHQLRVAGRILARQHPEVAVKLGI